MKVSNRECLISELQKLLKRSTTTRPVYKLSVGMQYGSSPTQYLDLLNIETSILLPARPSRLQSFSKPTTYLIPSPCHLGLWPSGNALITPSGPLFLPLSACKHHGLRLTTPTGSYTARFASQSCLSPVVSALHSHKSAHSTYTWAPSSPSVQV